MREFENRLAVVKCDTVSKMGFVISTSTNHERIAFRNRQPKSEFFGHLGLDFV